MAHESCKSQIAVLEMNGQSVPQTKTLGDKICLKFFWEFKPKGNSAVINTQYNNRNFNSHLSCYYIIST